MVNPVGAIFGHTPAPRVPMVPAFCPRRVQACASNWTVEVLPLVPVTPTIVIAALGWPWNASAIAPIRLRSPLTGMASAGAGSSAGAGGS